MVCDCTGGDMSERAYSVRDIIVSKLKRLGCDGLASPDDDCGCGIADLAPCGGTCMDCLPARSRVTSEGIGWFAVGFARRPNDAKESNTVLACKPECEQRGGAE